MWVSLIYEYSSQGTVLIAWGAYPPNLLRASRSLHLTGDRRIGFLGGRCRRASRHVVGTAGGEQQVGMSARTRDTQGGDWRLETGVSLLLCRCPSDARRPVDRQVTTGEVAGFWPGRCRRSNRPGISQA